MEPLRSEDVDGKISSTPYLVADGADASSRYDFLAGKSAEIQVRSRVAYEGIASEAADRLGPCESIIRSELVAESNLMEGYDSSAREVRRLVQIHEEFMNSEIASFVEHIKDDDRLIEGLGLYRAYQLADEWAKAQQRPRQDEIRSLHSLVMPTLTTAGAYKRAPNAIGGSDHDTIPPWDVQHHMTDLSDWFVNGSGDALLDAAVVHAWLTHIHPFEDGNGRMARLLANLALVQSGYPSLLLRSVADRGAYLDALAASDEGDILPLYDLFSHALRRRLRELEKPDYVDRKIRSELFSSSVNRYKLWLEEMRNLETSLEHKGRGKGWRCIEMGYPSLEDFACLESRDQSGNCWFIKFRDRDTHRDEWLLWFGYQSQAMCDLIHGGVMNRAWPSIFFSRQTDDPRAVHKWRPLFDEKDPSRPDELSLAPASSKQVTARFGLETKSMDVTDAAALIIGSLERS